MTQQRETLVRNLPIGQAQRTLGVRVHKLREFVASQIVRNDPSTHQSAKLRSRHGLAPA